jgi:hypothetical protein
VVCAARAIHVDPVDSETSTAGHGAMSTVVAAGWRRSHRNHGRPRRLRGWIEEASCGATNGLGRAHERARGAAWSAGGRRAAARTMAGCPPAGVFLKRMPDTRSRSGRPSLALSGGSEEGSGRRALSARLPEHHLLACEPLDHGTQRKGLRLETKAGQGRLSMLNASTSSRKGKTCARSCDEAAATASHEQLKGRGQHPAPPDPVFGPFKGHAQQAQLRDTQQRRHKSSSASRPRSSGRRRGARRGVVGAYARA